MDLDFGCYYCDNALVNPDLDENNDYSAFTIASMPMYTRLMFCSGGGQPPRIEYDTYNDTYGKWDTRATYYPKYCPNCGRRLDEYIKRGKSLLETKRFT